MACPNEGVSTAASGRRVQGCNQLAGYKSGVPTLPLRLPALQLWRKTLLDGAFANIVWRAVCHQNSDEQKEYKVNAGANDSTSRLVFFKWTCLEKVKFISRNFGFCFHLVFILLIVFNFHIPPSPCFLWIKIVSVQRCWTRSVW